MIVLLLNHKADFSKENKVGHTPLCIAVENGHVKVAEALLDAGADIEALGNNNLNLRPLHMAAISINIEMVKLLLKRGADSLAKDKDSLTAADYAAINGREEIAKILVNHKTTAGTDTASSSMDGASSKNLATADSPLLR